LFILYHYLEKNLQFGLVSEPPQVLSARSFLVARFDTLNIPRNFSYVNSPIQGSSPRQRSLFNHGNSIRVSHAVSPSIHICTATTRKECETSKCPVHEHTSTLRTRKAGSHAKWTRNVGIYENLKSRRGSNRRKVYDCDGERTAHTMAHRLTHTQTHANTCTRALGVIAFPQRCLHPTVCSRARAPTRDPTHHADCANCLPVWIEWVYSRRAQSLRCINVVIVPPEGGLEFRWNSEMCWCFIHVTTKLVWTGS